MSSRPTVARRLVVPASAFLVVLLLALGVPALAAPDSPPPVPTMDGAATQFDFLLGEWRLDVKPKAVGLAQQVHGVPSLGGRWHAVRTPDGAAIEDDLAIVDAAGNPVARYRTLRIWSPADGAWLASTLDTGRARFSPGRGEWRDGAMHVSGSAIDRRREVYLTRARFDAIGADAFTYRQDRSFDGGDTWVVDALVIHATRARD